jgi:cell division inhibitor SepF
MSMGAARKVAGYLGLGRMEEYDEPYDDEPYGEPYDEYEDDWMPASERAAKRWQSDKGPARIVMIRPHKYSDAPTVGERFREGCAVVMDVSGMPLNEATRLVDFAAGLVFGCEGRIERVADKVFLLTPAHVEVSSI